MNICIIFNVLGNYIQCIGKLYSMYWEIDLKFESDFRAFQRPRIILSGMDIAHLYFTVVLF